MAASPVSVVLTPNSHCRRPLALTSRRIEANRRNAKRSTGPRSVDGKARVARNAVKHGFFVAQDRWTLRQQHDFAETLDGFRDDFKPRGMLEESLVASIAAAYVRVAAMLRYENIAALKYHQELDRELDERIAAATPAHAAQLRTHREELRRAGLWKPTLPSPRETKAILRYEGRLHRDIRHAASELKAIQNWRIGGLSPKREAQKQTHFEALRRVSGVTSIGIKAQKQTHSGPSPTHVRRAEAGPGEAHPSQHENAKTNPLSSMFTGNRHERRRAKALAKHTRT